MASKVTKAKIRILKLSVKKIRQNERSSECKQGFTNFVMILFRHVKKYKTPPSVQNGHEVNQS